MFDIKTIEHLKYYVYLLINPKTDEPFYVGKGIGEWVYNPQNTSITQIRNIVNEIDRN
jgi:hypothetical protein